MHAVTLYGEWDGQAVEPILFVEVTKPESSIEAKQEQEPN